MPTVTMTRTTAPATITLVAGEAAGSMQQALTSVQYTDLVGMYDQYRINWAKIRIIPRYDPGQSGVTNNTDVWIAAGSDVTNQVTTPTFLQVTAFDNSKVAPLLAGKEFQYTFYPKAMNALISSQFAVNSTDWLILSTGGAGTLHSNLIYNIKSGNAASVSTYDYVVEINFSVKQAS